MRIALTIAGSDPSGGAGIQADLKTFAAFGVYGASAITAITVQSTRGVEAVAPLTADLVTAQIEAVAGDLAIDATKIGMLATAAIVEAVAAAIKELELPLVVVDPVLVSTSGTRLLDDDGVQALCAELLPLARVVTPNVPEAEALTRHADRFAGGRARRRAADSRAWAPPPSSSPAAHGDVGTQGRGRSAVRRTRSSTNCERRASTAAKRTAPAARSRRRSPPGWRWGSRCPRRPPRSAVRRRRDRACARRSATAAGR